MNFDKIPVELRTLRQWVLWRLEPRHGRVTKVPYQPNGRQGDGTAPRTWNTFEVCLRAFEAGGFSGLGLVFARTDVDYAGVDLDKCRDPHTGITESWAAAIIRELSSYTELSQSGTGWHIIVKKSGLPVDGGRKARVEMYCHNRYFCVTGERAVGCGEVRAVSLADLYQRMVEGKLDPSTTDPGQARSRAGRDTSPSGTDYKIIASLARKLRSRDLALIEREIARRHPDRYVAQSEKHGGRQGQTYWHYSIVRFFERLEASLTW
jgi:putative DNA primase/helicase